MYSSMYKHTNAVVVVVVILSQEEEEEEESEENMQAQLIELNCLNILQWNYLVVIF